MRRALVLLLLAATAQTARAGDIQLSKPSAIWPSRHDVSTELGYQAGFGGSLGSPSGIKVGGAYAYRFHPMAWFEVQLANVFGFGGGSAPCVAGSGPGCYRGGYDFQLNVGVRLKFRTRLPITVEVPLMIGLDALYNRACGDDGIALPVTRGGAHLKYFVTPKIGLGVGANLAFGPAFHGHGSATCSGGAGNYSDLYGAFDILLGAEFIL